MAGGPSGLADEGSGLAEIKRHQTISQTDGKRCIITDLQVLLVLSNVSGLVGGRWFEEGYVWLRSRGSRVLPGSTGGMD